MMNRKSLACILILGAFLAPAATFAADSDSDRSSPKAYVKDSMITTKVKTALAKEKMSSLVKVHVDTDDKGIVYLGGTAPTKADADKAAQIAKGVDGVVSVKNNIKIKKED